MKHYTQKRIRPLRLVAMGVRFIARLIKLWPLVLIIVVLTSPITPHIRWDYRYIDTGDTRLITHCRYLGVKGYVHPGISECHLIAFFHHQSLLTTF